MYVHNLNPSLLQLGPLEIRWYGLVYVFGFLFAIYWLKYLAKKEKMNLSADDCWDLMLYIMVGVIVGARLFHLLWDLSYYLSNPLAILKIWQGGMSFHGGFVGSIVGTLFFCRKKKLSFFSLADALTVPALLALALGRIANFVNGELVGRISQGKWCVVFPKYDELCRHPSTLYEAGVRFILFGYVLWLYLRREFAPGFVFWNFVVLVGLGRILVDFFREDVIYFGFTLGQWLSVPMVVVGLIFLWLKHRKDLKHFFVRD